MKNIITSLILFSSFHTTAYCQQIIAGGFTGVAGINGTTYQRVTLIGDTTGGYPSVCAGRDGKFFTSSSSKHKLFFIDPTTFTVVDSMSHTFYAISASNEDNTLFARTDSGICRINTATKSILDSISVPNGFNMTERPNSKEVWIGANNKVYVVNYSSGLSSTTFQVGPSTNDNGEIVFTKGGTIAYKLAWFTNRIYKIDANTKALLDSVSSEAGNLAVSADSAKLYASLPSNNKILIYQTSNLALIDSIDCGSREPFDLFIHPTRNELWVVNHFKDSVSVYNETTKALIAAFRATGSPHGLAFSTGTSGVTTPVLSQNDVEIFPNPGNDIVTINISDNKEAKVLLYDIMGRIVKQLDMTTNTTTLSITTLTAGYYYFNIVRKDMPVKAIKWLKE